MVWVVMSVWVVAAVKGWMLFVGSATAAAAVTLLVAGELQHVHVLVLLRRRRKSTC